MEYTENLNLPVLEDSDTATSVFSQGNAIATQLENLFGDNLEDYQSLSDITTDVTGLKNDMSDIQGDITDLENEDTSLGNRITALNTLVTQLQSGRGVYTDADGIVHNGVYTTYCVEGTATGSVEHHVLSEASYTRNSSVTVSGSLVIDLYNVMGITSISNLILISACAYGRNTGVPLDTPAFTNPFICKFPSNQHYSLLFTANETSFVQQTADGTGGWTPADSTVFKNKYQDMNIKVTFTVFVEDPE